MAAYSHSKSNVVADMTGTVTVFNSQGSTATVAATDLVRPVDWNSAHNFFVTITGDTLGSSTASGTNLVFGGTNGVQIQMSTAAGAATAWFQESPMLFYDIIPAAAPSTTSGGLAPNSTSNVAYFFPFYLDEAVSAGFMNLPLSMAFLTVGTSSGRQTGGISAALYTRDAGTNSTRLSQVTGTSFGWSVTGNNSSYTINQYTASSYTGYGAAGATNSAGVNISSGYTGLKIAALPVNKLLPPGNYWLGIIGTNSTSSVNVGISASFVAQPQPGTAFAPMGSFSSAYTAGQNAPLGGAWYMGCGSFTTANQASLPSTLAISKLSEGVTWTPPLLFWST